MAKGAKPHKASTKRFKVSATGKLKRISAGKKHLNSHKSSKRKLNLRRPVASETAIAKKYVQILGEG
jgi:large subunit ribosomal protein L35